MYKLKKLKKNKSLLPEQILAIEVNEILLPSANISLVVEKPKNLELIDMVLQDKNRFIGVIVKNNKIRQKKVGCLGKIRSFIETDDMRYLINIDGICRFHMKNSLFLQKGQKYVKPEWQEFKQDLEISKQKIKDRLQLNYVISDYFNLIKNDNKYKLEDVNKIKDVDVIKLLTQNLKQQITNRELILNAKNIDELSAYYKGFMELKLAEYESRQFLKH